MYTLIGKAIDKQESAYIKASFAGKLQNIELTSYYLLKNNLGFQVKSELTLIKGNMVEGELIFKAISHHTKEETVSVPKFSYPKAWSSVNMELDEKSKQALINNNFKLTPQEEQTLT